MAKLDVEIVTGERVVLSETDVDMVVAPGSDGALGILPQHAPLISTLAAGELRVKKGNREQAIVVFGGFIEVTPAQGDRSWPIRPSASRRSMSTAPRRPAAAPKRRSGTAARRLRSRRRWPRCAARTCA